MSKEEKKSSPSPSHGLMFDPSHLLGVHPLSAAGFPFPHLNPLSNPYSLLGQPPRFPGLFGGLGGIPNPLHAAALSHTLAGGSDWWRIASEPISAPLPASAGAMVSTPASEASTVVPVSSTAGNASSTAALSGLDLPAHNPIGLGLFVGNLGLLAPATLGPVTGGDTAKPSIGLLLASPLELAQPPSYFGLSKHHNEIASTPTPSPTPSAHKRGRSSRASSGASSSHKQASRSSPSSTSPHLPSSPYLPPWSINGATLPYSHLPWDSKQKQSSSSPSSKRQKLSFEGEAKDVSHTAPQAHQQPHSSPLLTIPNAHSSQEHKVGADKSAANTFPFDPRAMISPYQMSPELAYLSQSLLLHRPDLALPPHFLASAASLPASLNSPSASSSGAKNMDSTRQQASPSATSSSKHMSSSSKNLSKTTSSSSKSDKSRAERLTKEDTSRKNSDNLRHSLDSFHQSKISELVESMDDKNLTDLACRMLDGDRRKQIAEHIRKRVGKLDAESDLVRPGSKHSADWPYGDPSPSDAKPRGECLEKPRDVASSSVVDALKKNSHQDESFHHSAAKKLHLKFGHLLGKFDAQEVDGRRQEEQSGNKSLFGEESMSSTLDESCESIGHSEHEESKLDNSSASENLDLNSHSGSDSEDSQGGKHAADGSTDEGSPNKKRPTQPDERELIIPLEHGWNRQTIINGMGRRGIVGEVVYFAPCGKKMKTIPDVMRYLERNPNSDLGRENFSFNTKVNIGHFYEVRGGQDPVPLSDAEVLEKIEMSRGKRARMQMLARQRREKAAREQAFAQQVIDLKLKRRMELQDMVHQATISRLERQQEKQRQKEMEKKERENKVLERRKEKEQHKKDKLQEKLRLQEQLRKERELKAQQIIEARNRRQRELEEMRLADALQRNKERDMKRQQLVILKEQEKERRRQHLLLLKALEQRKRQEEKLHQRRVEMEVAMELKKPIEDMELKNAKPLPDFPRMKSKLAGRPIADCLMAVEFLNNFGLALNLEKSSIPTIESLERGILNESDEDVEEFMSLIMHLLRFAIDDVGVPNPKEALTKLHQKITEMEMTDTTMSEILRIFLKARGEKEMSEWLIERPMEALNPTKKAAILAYLCNELLTSKAVTNEIDRHMDSINNLRRDKWVVEGQLRQLRVFQARKFNKVHKSSDRRPTINSSVSPDEDTLNSSKAGSEEEDDKEEEEDKDDDEESESEDSSSVITTSSSNMPFEPVDENLTKEESDRKIEKLRKQHANYRQKVFRASLRLRAINIGLDRYKRTYWILPLTGGVYVEGMESGVPEDYLAEQAKKDEVVLKVEDSEAEKVKEETVSDNVQVKVEADNLDMVVDNKLEEETSSIENNLETVRVNVSETVNSNEEVNCTELSASCIQKVKVNLASKSDESSEQPHMEVESQVLDGVETTDGQTSFHKDVLSSSVSSMKVLVTLSDNLPIQPVLQDNKGIGTCSSSPKLDLLGGTSNVTCAVPEKQQEESRQESFLLRSPTSSLPAVGTKPELPGPSSDLSAKHATVSDILKVPRIGGVDRGTLVTLLNNSIHQAFQEEESLGQNLMSTPVTTSSTTVISSPATTSSMPPLLTSSLLFSSIPKLPQPAHCILSQDLSCKPKSGLLMDTPSIASLPVPAHSTTINPQSLPPFHPSAQANLMLDLPPPVAHSGHSKSSALPLLGPPHPLAQSPFIPGLPHYPYGLSSASETLSSLASIVSPPPAHSHPITTTSIPSPLSTSTTLQSLTSSLPTANNLMYPKLEKNEKKEPQFTSSELLQQAASQVLKSAETLKPTTLVPSLKAGAAPSSSKDADDTMSPEVVDHKVWFSLLPRMPCDELSLTQPTSSQPSPAPLHPSPSLPVSFSALASYMNSPTKANLDALLPLIHSSPGLLSSDMFSSQFTSPATPSMSPTPCSTPGVDSSGEFKVPPPPDMNLSSDPWELVRAAQGEAQPIPRNLQHGWWRIYDLGMLKTVMSNTLNRGIREKNLQRSIHRYLDYAKIHCEADSVKPEPDSIASQGSSDVKIITKAEKISEDTVRESSDIARQAEPVNQLDQMVVAESTDDGVTTQVKEEVAIQTEMTSCGVEDFVVPDDPDWWSVPCLHQIELAVLDEVEALEERIFQASLQAKQGWKPNKDINIELVDRSVKDVADNQSYPLDMAISRLLELEANVERRYLKPPLIRSVQLNLSNLSAQSDRLDGDFNETESIPPGLLLWRQAVVGSESPAQLSLCTQMLAKSISWEKSIMRVTCQICSKDDNEAQLLLCDGCDKGYHTYCFKPKMENIPDGDWYCFECVSKASGTPHCVVCGSPGGRIVACARCPRHIHLECLDPPLPRMPKRWQCSNCLSDKGNSKRSKKRKESLPTVQRISITKLVVKEEPIDADELSAMSSSSCYNSPAACSNGNSPEKGSRKGSARSHDTQQQTADKKKRKKKDKEDNQASASPAKTKKKKEKKVPEKTVEEVNGENGDGEVGSIDLLACGKLLSEMEKHEHGWPFLKPVSRKQFPSYKKYIKFPMDFTTARNKLKTRDYKHRQEFAADMRLIFNNCETFNEDDSDVGQAGFNMRQYFENRWLELFPEDAS